ncbi:hypothetical protein NC653_019970 [Populus alba x Populus x berolinensis]|uniref:Endonuclease/exonuclease/phosphatase domain-containing protein n=2 Tax=Populus TaxID=3689 RepID=A0A4U5MB89_POPAL|nr:hypothetical protein NC653_019970 [Populus alba x Populus x berolinensis]TKR66396.1 hypothetical protein D5086_0000310860 [Populus alba]
MEIYWILWVTCSQQTKGSWNILRRAFIRRSDLSWLCMGDFNDLQSVDDKRGLHDHPHALIQGYRVAIEECQLTGIPLLAFPFTWERGRGTDHWVQERLDRAMGTGPWLHHFTNTELHNLTASISDHNPLLLVYRKQCIYRKHIRFRFENAWIREPELGGMIRKAWDDTAGERVLQRFSVCTQRLSD